MGAIDSQPQVVGAQLNCGSTRKIQFYAQGVREIEVVGESVGGDLSVSWLSKNGAEVLAKPVTLGSEKKSFPVALEPLGDKNYVNTLNPVNCSGDINSTLSLSQRILHPTKESQSSSELVLWFSCPSHFHCFAGRFFRNAPSEKECG